MPPKLLPLKPSEPVQNIHLPAPPPPQGSVNDSQVFVAPWNDGVVEVSGIHQCTAIFIRNDNTGARYAAHFGGWANQRRPKPNDMRAKVHRVIFGPGLAPLGGHRFGFEHISVTICKRGTSRQNSLAEAERALRAVLPGGIPIVHAEAPGQRFFFAANGEVFGSPA